MDAERTLTEVNFMTAKDDSGGSLPKSEGCLGRDLAPDAPTPTTDPVNRDGRGSAAGASNDLLDPTIASTPSTQPSEDTSGTAVRGSGGPRRPGRSGAGSYLAPRPGHGVIAALVVSPGRR